MHRNKTFRATIEVEYTEMRKYIITFNARNKEEAKSMVEDSFEDMVHGEEPENTYAGDLGLINIIVEEV